VSRVAPAWAIRDRGLHGGAETLLTISATEGPTTLGRGDDRAPLAALRFTGGDRGTDVELPSGARLRTVEHVLAAIAGVSAFAGARIDLDGEEAPLCDGGARTFAEALRPFARPVAPLCVAHPTRFQVDEAVFELAPSERLSVTVEVAFPVERFGVPLEGVATWAGDPEGFLEQIAPSRTFGAARELEALRARGLAAYVPEGVVVALDRPERAPRDPAEPVRHKLLDLLGDLATLGAPLRGAITVRRPSHRALHAALPRLRASLRDSTQPG